MTSTNDQISMVTPEQREAIEIFLIDLMDFLTESVIITDNQWRILFFSQGAERNFQHLAVEVHDQPIEVLFPENLAGKYHSYIQKISALPDINYQSDEPLEIIANRKDNSQFPAKISVIKQFHQGEAYYVIILKDNTHPKWNNYVGSTNDLTNRGKLETALRIQAQIINQIHDAVVSTDLNGYINSWNQGAQRLFGYLSREAVGQHISFVYPDELHSFLQDQVIAPLMQKSAHEVEVEMLKKSGERFFAHLSLSLLRDPAGEVSGMIGYSMDITDRKKVESYLRYTNQRMTNILESIAEGFYSLDHQWRFIYLNQRACQLLKKSSQELLGKSIWEAYPDTIDSEVYTAYHKAVEEAEPAELEIFYEPLQGWFDVRAYPYQDGMSVYFTEISERRLAQKEIETRARQQRVIADLSQKALTNPPIQELMDEIVSRMAKTLQVEYCKIMELLPDGKALLLRAGVGWKDGYVGQSMVKTNRNSQAGFTLLSREPVIVENLLSEDRFTGPPLLLDHGVISGMSVVIDQPGRPFGILGAHTSQKRSFTNDDAHFLQSVANLLALAIERKSIEEHLAYQADLLANVHDAIIATDHHFIITSWNEAAEGLYGWKADEVLGRPIQEVIREAGPQDFRGIQALNTLAENGSYITEVIQFRKDDTPVYVEGRTISLRDTSGGVRGYVSVNRDITERKEAEVARRESEERFRQLSENLPEVFWMTNADGSQLLYLSPAFDDIWGRPRQSVYDCPRSGMEAIHPQDQERVRNSYTPEHLQAGDYSIEYRILRPDGQIRWIHDRGFPIQDSQGKVYRIAGIAVDITSQVQAEQKLRQLGRQVVTAQEEERQRISRELHDEAGQALTALKIGLDLIQADLPDLPSAINRSIGEAMELVDKTVEQIRSIAYQLRPPELDALGLSPVLEVSCQNFSKQTHIDVQYRGVELPNLYDAEAVCFYRLVQEALTNIIKHARAQHVEVSLDYDLNSLYLRIEDDGQGFDRTVIDSPSSNRPGLGLLGMQERVELLGGRLLIDTQIGQGTRLTAVIPRRKME